MTDTSGKVTARWRVPLADILVDDDLLDAVAGVVGSGWWSMGPQVEAFEQEFALFCGARHALAVSNGSTALHLALVAAGVVPGDEVVIPSLTFVAAANAISHCGAMPIFCDISGSDDLNLSPDAVEAAVGERTKAIIAFHYGGHACDVSAILEIAEKHNLLVVEDAAHALGGSLGGKHCGTFGAAGCFSFFSNKNLATGEGGMVVTDDDALADRARLLRSHGMTTLTWARHSGHASSYDVVARGSNYRLDEIHAAIGRVQLKRLPAHNESRAQIVAHYRAELHGAVGLTMPFADQGDTVPAHHLAVVVLPPECPRDAVRARLTETGIQTSVHYPPIHHFTAYERTRWQEALPVTNALSSRILTIPLFAHMDASQVDMVIENLLEAVASEAAV
jgi:dTDP-4-amino-4,6-dideoxygalactose transaminase